MTVWDRLRAEPYALEIITDALKQAEFWEFDGDNDGRWGRQFMALQLLETIKESREPIRATPAQERIVGNELVNRQTVKFNGRMIGFVFDDVPDLQKKPPGPGPFEQVPPGFSTPEIGSLFGLWWRVTPFNPTPWAVLVSATFEVLPDGFEAIFGGRPHSSQFHGEKTASDFQVATVTWESNLKTYVGPGMPEDADPAKVEAANDEAVKYEMGDSAYYENIHGFKVRFPDSQEPNFEAPFDGFVNTGTGQVIVSYQTRLTDSGVVIPVGKMHPMAPTVLTQRQVELRNKARKEAA